MRNRMFIAAAGLVIAAFAYLTQPPAAAFSGPADTPQNASAGFAQPMLDTAAAETRAQAAQEMHPSAYTPAKRSTPMLALMIVTSLLSAALAGLVLLDHLIGKRSFGPHHDEHAHGFRDPVIDRTDTMVTRLS